MKVSVSAEGIIHQIIFLWNGVIKLFPKFQSNLHLIFKCHCPFCCIILVANIVNPKLDNYQSRNSKFCICREILNSIVRLKNFDIISWGFLNYWCQTIIFFARFKGFLSNECSVFTKEINPLVCIDMSP